MTPREFEKSALEAWKRRPRGPAFRFFFTTSARIDANCALP